MSNVHPASHFELEAKIDHMIQLMSKVVNQISSPKPNDPTIPISTLFILNHNHEDKWQEIKMIVDEGKSKIEVLEN